MRYMGFANLFKKNATKGGNTLRHFGLTINASRPRGARARVENRGSGISRMRSIADRPLNCRWLSMSDMRVFLAIILLEIAPLCS